MQCINNAGHKKNHTGTIKERLYSLHSITGLVWKSCPVIRWSGNQIMTRLPDYFVANQIRS